MFALHLNSRVKADAGDVALGAAEVPYDSSVRRSDCCYNWYGRCRLRNLRDELMIEAHEDDVRLRLHDIACNFCIMFRATFSEISLHYKVFAFGVSKLAQASEDG